MKKSTSHNTKAKETRELIISEMAEDAWSEVNKELAKVRDRLQEDLPHRVFQEKHTTGFLWSRHTYYSYWRYSEGSMVPVSRISKALIERSEKK